MAKFSPTLNLVISGLLFTNVSSVRKLSGEFELEALQGCHMIPDCLPDILCTVIEIRCLIYSLASCTAIWETDRHQNVMLKRHIDRHNSFR